MISGSSRLVWATMQLGLIAFGIVAGVSAAGVPPERAFSSSDALLGDWAPWLGVLVFAVGVMVAHSTPPAHCCRCSSSSTPHGPARCSATHCSAPTRAASSGPS